MDNNNPYQGQQGYQDQQGGQYQQNYQNQQGGQYQQGYQDQQGYGQGQKGAHYRECYLSFLSHGTPSLSPPGSAF